MPVQIKEISSNKELKKFISLPWKIYKNDTNWVPPLKIAIKELFAPNHPFLETGEMKLFLALRNNEIVGRIAAIINHSHNEFWNEKTGFWGFFESIEDKEVSNELLETA